MSELGYLYEVEISLCSDDSVFNMFVQNGKNPFGENFSDISKLFKIYKIKNPVVYQNNTYFVCKQIGSDDTFVISRGRITEFISFKIKLAQFVKKCLNGIVNNEDTVDQSFNDIRRSVEDSWCFKTKVYVTKQISKSYSSQNKDFIKDIIANSINEFFSESVEFVESAELCEPVKSYPNSSNILISKIKNNTLSVFEKRLKFVKDRIQSLETQREERIQWYLQAIEKYKADYQKSIDAWSEEKSKIEALIHSMEGN